VKLENAEAVAKRCLQDFLDEAKTSGLPSTVRLSLTVRVLSRLGRFVTKKKHDSYPEFKNVTDIGDLFDEEWNMYRSKGALPAPPKKKAKTDEVHLAPAGLDADSINVVGYDAAGALVDQSATLREDGFERGVVVKEKGAASLRLAVVENIGGGAVTLFFYKERTRQTVKSGEFRSGYELVYDAAEVRDRGVVLDLEHLLAPSTDKYEIHMLKARVLQGLDAVRQFAETKCKRHEIHVETKPKRVLAQCAYGVGELILVPLTCNMHVDALKDDKVTSPKPGWVDPGVATENGRKLFLQPHFAMKTDKDEGFVEPFWAVTPVEAEEDANMELSTCRIGQATVVTLTGSGDGMAFNETFTLPILRNKVPLAVNDVLSRYVPKDTKGRTKPVKYSQPQPNKKDVPSHDL